MTLIMPPNEVQELKNKLDRIAGFIFNDSTTGTPGLVQQVRDMREDLDKLIDSINIERERRKVWGVVFGAIGAGLVWLAQRIVAHFI